MDSSKGEMNPESVEAKVELTGAYADVISVVGEGGFEYGGLGAVVDGMTAVLRAVEQTGGATKSALAAELPDGEATGLSGDEVGTILAALELYGLVELEGNTWTPGPEVE